MKFNFDEPLLLEASSEQIARAGEMIDATSGDGSLLDALLFLLVIRKAELTRPGTIAKTLAEIENRAQTPAAKKRKPVQPKC